MQRPAQTKPLASSLLQELYDEGYFHGTNSGFDHAGYAQVHATWQHWMPWVRQEVGTGARWLDLGCAYGFLVAEARSEGFFAIGLDVSRFALGQIDTHAPEAAGRAVLGHADRLPFASDHFDVVTGFDVLEHVPAAEQVLREAARVLRPGGLFVAATPDPMTFGREEPTHFCERVPSWWIRELERAGFSVALRFFQAEYNCELVARLGGPEPAISFDGLEPETVFPQHSQQGLHLVPRRGVGAVESDGCRVVEDGAGFYLLHCADRPREVEIEIELADAVPAVLRLDGRTVGRCEGRDRVWRSRFVVGRGGHGLRLGIEGGWARLCRVRLDAAATGSNTLCETLPFDLFERYALTAEVLRRIGAPPSSLLDVGGTMGAGDGHLAWTGDFLPDHDITVIDGRPADVPEHRTLSVSRPLPFEDRAFAAVSAQDVLEHVPAHDRTTWLEEVWRVTDRFLLLGGPWATPGVAEADRYLFELIRSRFGYEHAFLAEHLGHGHPDLEEARRFFEARSASVSILPSGYLQAWILMQTVNAWLSHPQQDQSFVHANRAFNQAVGLRAVASPAYRHLLVVDRQGVEHAAALGDLVFSQGPDLEAVEAAISALLRSDRAAVEETS